ncbi:transposable element Tcb2 transposase [Trichonephila clavipes]|nr:transposable element Tcb2 transposase [Trichonephila clavipes]
MSFTRRPGSGRPRQTSRREDRHIGTLCLLEPFEGAWMKDIWDHVAHYVCCHRRLRLEWCSSGGNWTAMEWNQVVFNDEYRFNLISDDNHVHVWRPRGERLNPAFALQRRTAPTTATLPWPARSPDLSPIQHIWDHLGRQVGPPSSLNELEARFQQIWNEMSQDFKQNLYASMPDRIASCIRDRGGSTGSKSTDFSESNLRSYHRKGEIGEVFLNQCVFMTFWEGFAGNTFSMKPEGDRRRSLGKSPCGLVLEEGRSVTSVAAEFGIAQSIVSRLWRQFQTTGTAIRGFSSGRPRGTTPADGRYIALQARRNRRQTAGEIARHTTQATGRPISRFTVARRLHCCSLFARRPVQCVPLTPAHRRRRSLWCREHRNWRDNEWGRILFTDESRFSLSSDSHRILIWRQRGSRNHPSNIIERDRYGGRGVLVWGGIMLGSRTDLHIFDVVSVNGTRYCNEILLPYVRFFRGAMGLQFLFMDDNAACHRTVAAEQLLESEDIERMDWPARSPDLNPIEHVWDFLGRRLAARTLPPVTIRELRLALQDEWTAMPQQLIYTLILSMGRRCETCLAVRGDDIP